MKINFYSFILVTILLISSFNVSAFTASNESVTAKNSLDLAYGNILDMINRSIPVARVNETYVEALQLYSAQLALESKSGIGRYSLVIDYSSEIGLVRDVAIKSKDELSIFIETFNNLKNDVNLSEMTGKYDSIVLSFEEERFEETLILIDGGYDRISEIQSKQTAINAVYEATTNTLKNFFINYWIEILVSLIVLILLFFIFRENLEKFMTKRKLDHLSAQKIAIALLIKRIQGEYFKTKKISSVEYKVKLKKFKEMVRDIDRQIMTIKEDEFKGKIGKKLKSKK